MSNIDPKKQVKINSSESSVLSVRRSIPTSSFDFLQGEFKKTSRARSLAFGIILILVSVLVYVFVLGFVTSSKTIGYKSQAEANHTERIKVITSLGVVTKYKDVTADQVLKKTHDISIATQNAAISEPDMFGIMGKLRDISQNGVVYNTVTFCTTDPSSGSCGTNDVPEKGKELTNIHYVLVSVSTTDFNAAAQWYADFKNINWFIPAGEGEKTYLRNGSGLVAWAKIVDNLVPLDTKNALAQIGLQLNFQSIPPAEQVANGGTR